MKKKNLFLFQGYCLDRYRKVLHILDIEYTYPECSTIEMCEHESKVDGRRGHGQ